MVSEDAINEEPCEVRRRHFFDTRNEVSGVGESITNNKNGVVVKGFWELHNEIH